MSKILVFLDIVAVLTQFLAAWFAYRIYKFNRLSSWWLALIIAFIFQAARRIFQAYNDWFGFNTNPLFDRILMFLISIFLAMGLWSMLKNFENFEVVEKKVNKLARRK